MARKTNYRAVTLPFAFRDPRVEYRLDFGYRKVRYKGLAKNQAQIFSLFGLANLVLATRCEGRVDGASGP